ncbi:hypothetical protein T484DRAFT_1755358 [Baffinella frigidus]|nr:hypothetical protein T484DRAFT_1755358 [Cryptophyta sp. CCMP2293]
MVDTPLGTPRKESDRKRLCEGGQDGGSAATLSKKAKIDELAKKRKAKDANSPASRGDSIVTKKLDHGRASWHAPYKLMHARRLAARAAEADRRRQANHNKSIESIWSKFKSHSSKSLKKALGHIHRCGRCDRCGRCNRGRCKRSGNSFCDRIRVLCRSRGGLRNMPRFDRVYF